MVRPFKLTPAEVDEIWARWRSGQAVKVLARQMRVNPSTVRDLLHRTGGRRRRPGDLSPRRTDPRSEGHRERAGGPPAYAGDDRVVGHRSENPSDTTHGCPPHLVPSGRMRTIQTRRSATTPAASERPRPTTVQGASDRETCTSSGARRAMPTEHWAPDPITWALRALDLAGSELWALWCPATITAEVAPDVLTRRAEWQSFTVVAVHGSQRGI